MYYPSYYQVTTITVLTTNAAVSAYSVMNCPWKFIKLGDVQLVF